MAALASMHSLPTGIVFIHPISFLLFTSIVLARFPLSTVVEVIGYLVSLPAIYLDPTVSLPLLVPTVLYLLLEVIRC